MWLSQWQSYKIPSDARSGHPNWPGDLTLEGRRALPTNCTVHVHNVWNWWGYNHSKFRGAKLCGFPTLQCFMFPALLWVLFCSTSHSHCYEYISSWACLLGQDSSVYAGVLQSTYAVNKTAWAGGVWIIGHSYTYRIATNNNEKVAFVASMHGQ